MKFFSKLALGRILLVINLFIFLNCGQSDKKTISANIITEAIKTPNFSLPTLEGQTIDLINYRGKFVVLHIATTWCLFCNAEAPHLENLFQDYKDKNVEVLLMDVKEPKELIEEKLRKKYN